MENIIKYDKYEDHKNYQEDFLINGKPKSLPYYQLYDRYLRLVRNSVHHYLKMGGGGLQVQCDIELIIKK